MLTLLLFVAALIFFMSLPYSTRFLIAISSSIFQVYTFACFGFYPSVALLSYASLAPKLISLRRAFLQLPVMFLTALIVVQMMSLAWSPDRHFGFTTILYEIPFLIVYLVAFSLSLNNTETLIKYLKIYALLSLVPLLFIITFALDPSINLMYVKSSLAGLFNHPHSIEWYIKGYPTGQWEGKPRGIIFDPNASGNYLGICALVFFGLGVYCRENWLKLIGLLHWIGIFFTSVVAAMCLAFIVPIIILSAYCFSENKMFYGVSFRKFFIYSLIGMSLTCSVVLFANDVLSAFVMEKLLSRLILWKYALVTLPGHLLGGLGFGGVEQIYADLYPSAPDVPAYRPHNTIIAILAQSGIVAALLAIAFIVSVLATCWRIFATAVDKRQRIVILLFSGAILWMFLHAMGENWGIVSEIHAQPLVAAIFGLMVGIYYKKNSPMR